MKSQFAHLIVAVIFLGLAGHALADVSLSGNVMTIGTVPACSQSGASSGSTASINLTCSVGQAYANVVGTANLSSGNLAATVESGPQVGGNFDAHLMLSQNYLVTGSSGLVSIQIDAGGDFEHFGDASFTLMFDGQTISGISPTNAVYTFDVTQGQIYYLQLSALLLGGEDNGNSAFVTFDYTIDPALTPVPGIPEPSGLR